MRRHPASRWLWPLLGVLVLAACAQGGPPGSERGGDRGPGGRGGPPDMAGAGPSLGRMHSPDEARRYLMEQTGRQLADARQQLRIAPAQSAAWDAYAASVGALVSDVARFESDPIGATSLQRMDRRVDRARNRYTAMENISDAMKSLYATFSDEQRSTADRILAGTLPSLYEGNPFGNGGGMEPGQRTPGSAPPPRPGRGEPPKR